MIRQAQTNKKELLRYYDQFGEAAGCLRGEENKCDRFDRIIQKTPSALPPTNPYDPPLPPDVQKVNQQFGVVQCLEKEIEDAKDYNLVARSGGEITLGLVIGGVGGIYGLGATAVRIFRHGYRLKGILSLMGLGTLGITTYKNFNLLKLKCKEASRHIIGLDQIETRQVACLPKSYPQNISLYLSCLTEVALTAAVVVPAVAGKGINLTSKAKLKTTKMKVDKVKHRDMKIRTKKDLEEFKGVLNNRQSVEYAKLLDEFGPEELARIRPYIKFVKEENIDPLILHRALRYSRILSPKKRERFITHLDEAIKGETGSINRQVRNFLKGEKRYAKRVAKLEKKYSKKLPPDAARDTAQEVAKAKSHAVEDILLSCRARNMNASHRRSIPLFGKFTTAMVGTSIVTGFSGANWHLPKDTEWFGRLGYELVYAVMYTKILVKVMKNPSSSLVKRYGQFNVGATVVAGIDSGIYSQFFNLDEDDARDALNRIKNSPQKMKDLERLSEYLDKSNFVETFKKSMAQNFKNLLKSRQKSSEDEEEDLLDGLEDLAKKDLDDPKIQDKLLEAVMAQYYDSERGYFNLGKGVDRFAFNRLWSGVMAIPKEIALAVPLYYSLCMTAAYPVGGLLAAAGIQALNQLTTYDVYYKTRTKMINQ